MGMNAICLKTGKFSYLSKSEASHARHEFRNRRGFKTALEVYQCQFCNCWHFGRRSIWKGGGKHA